MNPTSPAATSLVNPPSPAFPFLLFLIRSRGPDHAFPQPAPITPGRSDRAAPGEATVYTPIKPALVEGPPTEATEAHAHAPPPPIYSLRFSFLPPSHPSSPPTPSSTKPKWTEDLSRAGPCSVLATRLCPLASSARRCDPARSLSVASTQLT